MKLKTRVGIFFFSTWYQSLSAEGQFGTAKGKITVADFSLRKFQKADFFINSSYLYYSSAIFQF